MSAVTKEYFRNPENSQGKKTVMVSFMPCTAKKMEAKRPNSYTNGEQDTDYVITTTEFIDMIRMTGIDFAMTSLFTVIFVEQWQSTKCHIPALMGLAAAAVSLAILGPDNFILPAMLAICVMLVAMRGRLAKEVA